jgi:hypothetical protein
MKVLAPVKRVVDFNVKVRVKGAVNPFHEVLTPL